MIWWRHIITGANNSTVSIGRVLGLIVFVVFVIALPVAAMITTFKKWVPISEWVPLIHELTVYLPAVLVAIMAVIAGTAPSEPKPRQGNPEDGGNPCP